ncbi:P-loop containing nucleoside triphosphate hydrolase protein [Sporodiniella umbellata]|nr:P-loop containing nucleoside triphosphate hydrolase protein [Sporodiniella umbellata]
MSMLLLDTLKKAELDQYSFSFSSNGITQLETLAQLSLQEYSSLGITSVGDRKKLFHLVQSLRQETPSLDNGLVSPQAKTKRLERPIDRLPEPRVVRTVAHRARAYTLNALEPEEPYGVERREREDDASEGEERCEIRRGSNPLLDPYGVPIKARSLSKPNALAGVPSDLDQKIRVCVRKRPLNRKETDRGEKDIAPTCGIRSINIQEPKMKLDLTKYIEQHSFTFDDVFDDNETNEKIYARTAQPLVQYVFRGGKATCFAYGQTGSGKTFTMLDPYHGLYVLAARDVFKWIHQPEYEHLSAWIGFYEIYQGQLYDLLNERKKLFAREDGKQNVVIVGLKEFVIKNVQDLMQVFEYGSQARSTGSTGANSDSSRSHAVLQILLRPTKNRKKIIGKLSFIDLAGSERGADRGDADIKTRMEGAEINKSLLALKECIRALDQDKRHTPFRQSKLTQVLKDSFVGNSRTCMIATISPNLSNSEHTLNTLRYADRVKELKGEREARAKTLPLPPPPPPPPARSFAFPEPEDDREGDPEENLEDCYQQGYPQEYIDPDERFYPDELDSDADPLDPDLLLQDFPTRDVHILDKDFPHENKLSPLHPPTLSAEPCLLFDPAVIQAFTRFHRAQIREVTEYSKAETKLLANFSLALSSRREQLPQASLKDDIKTSSEFIEYLDNLDEVLESKTAAIEALRDRIRLVLGEEEF